ncbi:MAG: motility associated factor glycosyltransferase family protein, partial [Synergistetes bacterium]|nr:motility associated factor glycosyltransferase family protein [Synergistota bacterium]
MKHKDRSLFDRLKKVERAPYVSFISSKSGHVVARVLGKDKRVYLLHSSYDPLSEAEDVASKVNWFGVSHVVVMGIGCGYQLLPILRRVPKNVRVYAVEPDIALFKAVFETIDWTEILSFQNLHLVVGLPPLNAADAIMRTLNPSELKAIEFLKHPVYYRLLHGYFSELERRISESIRISLVNLITALQFSFRDQKNTLLNLKWLFRGSPVKNIFRSFVKKPAVVVCAGPSLDKNIYYLWEVK